MFLSAGASYLCTLPVVHCPVWALPSYVRCPRPPPLPPTYTTTYKKKPVLHTNFVLRSLFVRGQEELRQRILPRHTTTQLHTHTHNNTHTHTHTHTHTQEELKQRILASPLKYADALRDTSTALLVLRLWRNQVRHARSANQN